MNSDQIKSGLTRVAAPVLAWAAGRYHLSVDQVAAMTSDIGYLGSVAAVGYGFYQHWGMKKVPEASTAIIQTQPAMTGQSGTIATGKVVG